MTLPNAEDVVVPEAKITHYLLAETHPTGRGKAQFFVSLGFRAESWRTLAAALRQHAQDCELAAVETTSFGRRYVVEGPIKSPDGRNPNLRSVWFVEGEGEPPRLVTAYACRREAQR